MQASVRSVVIHLVTHMASWVSVDGVTVLIGVAVPPVFEGLIVL